MIETCFVVMPIGDQEYPGGRIDAKELKARYDDLIKEALLRAHPSLEVVRADEVSAPGAITSDIITRIMHSDYVLGDITFPNPNVFYELGLRHACRLGTLIVRDKAGPKAPFDVAQLRHYDYEYTPTGLKTLSEHFASYFKHRREHPDHPDNQFQELAKLTHYEFPDYGKTASAADLQTDAFLAVLREPKLRDLLMRSGAGEDVSQTEMMQAMAEHPDVARIFIQALASSGQFAPFERLNEKGGAKRKRKR